MAAPTDGQRELVEALTGLRKYRATSVMMNGSDALGLTPHDVHDLGVGHVPEDREKDGVVGQYSVADNMVLNRFDERESRRRAYVTAKP